MPGKANVACAEEILLKVIKRKPMRFDWTCFTQPSLSGSHAVPQGAGQNIIIAKTTQAGEACLLPHWFSRNLNSLNPNSLKQSWFTALLLAKRKMPPRAIGNRTFSTKDISSGNSTRARISGRRIGAARRDEPKISKMKRDFKWKQGGNAAIASTPPTDQRLAASLTRKDFFPLYFSVSCINILRSSIELLEEHYVLFLNYFRMQGLFFKSQK